MHVQLLIDDIVRQTTVLIAQLSTAAGVRAPLSQVADQVFLELSRELSAQGVRQKVAADMFGMALRSYQMKVRRLSEPLADQPLTLWQAIYVRLCAGSATREELEKQFRSHPAMNVAAALDDMVQSGIAYASGRGHSSVYGLTSPADRERLSAAARTGASTDDDISQTCWGKGYWPEAVRCEMATLTEVLSVGLNIREVGGVVSLPWAEGPPEPF